MRLDFWIRPQYKRWKVGLFNEKDSILFSIVRMPDKSSNVPSSIVYSTIGPASLKIVRASNNPELSPQQLNRLLPVKKQTLKKY